MRSASASLRMTVFFVLVITPATSLLPLEAIPLVSATCSRFPSPYPLHCSRNPICS